MMAIIDVKGRLRREGSSSISGLSFSAEDYFPSPAKADKVPTQSKRNCYGMRAVLLIALLCSVLTVVLLFDKSAVSDIAKSLEEDEDGYGMLVFFGLSIVAVMCFFPGPILATFAGVLYGKVWGSLVIWAAGTISQSLTFLIGKYLLREALVTFISRRYKAFPTIDGVIAQQGWKIILLLRLSPIIPDSVLNYVLATTSIPYVSYSIASSIAILPWTIVFAYFGSFATDVTAASSDSSVMQSKWLTLLSVVSLLVLAIAGYFIARTAQRALAGVIDDNNKSQA